MISTSTSAGFGLCRAWVNYKGTATRAIRGSYNVSSVTYNSTGDYTINFTNALVDGNYDISATASHNSGVSAPLFACINANTAPSSTSFGIRTFNASSSNIDSDFVCASIFR
jgi:hypothetical protein